MKVSRIEIKDYQQFKDFTLDLTYPAGHPKAGQSLDKVCFIGQSGTGKTTILNVISDLINNLSFTKTDKVPSLKKLNLKEYTEIKLSFQYEEYSKKLRSSDITLKNGTYNQGEILFNTIEDIGNLVMKITEEYIEIEKRIRVIYLETGLEKQIQLLIEEKEVINNKLLANIKKQEQHDWELAEESYKISKIIKSSYDFYFDSFRYFLLNNLNQYDKKYSNYLQELPQKLKDRNPNEVADELQKWSVENPNPRVEIAKRLNEKLNYFNLKIDEEWTKGGILIKNLQNESVPLDGISTGTKQILLTAIVLYLLESKDKIILFDEPENSLYPDIQRTLIKYYTDLAPEAQFFFATHSPLIASQFEPWEIVELEFDTETGFVQRKNYYEGENTVDNYTIYPQYLRWDDILTKVFDLDYEGNADFREELLSKTLRLKKQIAKMENENQQETEEYKQKIDKYIENAKKLGWTEEIRNADEKN